MAERDPAELGLWKLTLVRLSGVGLAVAGLWVVARAPVGGTSPFLGLALMLSGAAIVTFAARLFR